MATHSAPQQHHGRRMRAADSSPHTRRTPYTPSPLDDSTPRPIGVDPAQTGSFSVLKHGKGAHITTRNNAQQVRQAHELQGRPHKQRMTGVTRRRVPSHPGIASHPRVPSRPRTASHPRVPSHQAQIQSMNPQSRKKVYALLAVLVLVVVVLSFLGLRAVLAPPADTEKPAQQTQAAVGETLEHDGAAYALREQPDGTYALTYLAHNAENEQVLCSISGKPVGLFFFEGSLIMPENTDKGWNVMAYMRGVNSDAVPVQADGKAAAGDGNLSTATLEGSTLVLTTKEGATTKLDLS